MRNLELWKLYIGENPGDFGQGSDILNDLWKKKIDKLDFLP